MFLLVGHTARMKLDILRKERHWLVVEDTALQGGKCWWYSAWLLLSMCVLGQEAQIAPDGQTM